VARPAATSRPPVAVGGQRDGRDDRGVRGYLLLRRPLLANPFHLMHELQHHAVSEATLVVLAAIGSLMVLATGVLLLVIVAFAFAAMANERRLVAMVDRLRGR